MKFNIEIDCTPDEARHFLGLPDVAPMQRALLDAMEKRLHEVVASTDAKTLLDQWMPFGMKGIEQWQTMWAQMAAAASGAQRRPKGEK